MANIVHVPYPGETSCRGLCGQKIYNPPAPFEHNIGNLYPGKMIFISGIPNPKSPRFSINFKDGETYAFHMDVRFDYSGEQNVIVRNAKKDGAWGNRDSTPISKPFPFARDQFFEITVLIESDCYKVAVNSEHLFEFAHRYPLEKIHTLSIENDVRTNMVRIQG